MKKFRRAVRYYLLKFLRLKGTPLKVALGFALGACINFYPTFGAGVLLAGLLAGFFRVSITASLLGDIVFKSFFPVFFYFNLLTGNFLLGQKPKHIMGTLKKLLIMSRLNVVELKFFGKTFFYGALVNTLLLGALLTFLIYFVFSRYRINIARYVYRLKK